VDVDSQDGSEDFVADESEVDDETTLLYEESLPQDISAQEEINLLKCESEMSVDELRAKYAAVFAQSGNDDHNDSSNEESISSDSLNPKETSLNNFLSRVNDAVDNGAEEQLSGDMLNVQEFTHRNDEGSSDDDEVMSEADDGAGPSANQLLQEGSNDISDIDEYHPNPNDGVDDETTIEAEEKLGRDVSYADEIAALHREGEMTLTALRELYPNINDNDSEDMEADISYLDGEPTANDENDGDFEPDDDEKDDETTIEVEERLGREMTAEAELELLQQESEMTVEDLRKMYGQTCDDPLQEPPTKKMKTGDSHLTKACDDFQQNRADKGKAALDALEASAERARHTLATRPFLLSSWVKLREYQQVGLNWLVSLQSRRLNGVLADEMVSNFWPDFVNALRLAHISSATLGSWKNFTNNLIVLVSGVV
jgi:hypothetical protein